jgi:hypothetical protein
VIVTKKNDKSINDKRLLHLLRFDLRKQVQLGANDLIFDFDLFSKIRLKIKVMSDLHFQSGLYGKALEEKIQNIRQP